MKKYMCVENDAVLDYERNTLMSAAVLNTQSDEYQKKYIVRLIELSSNSDSHRDFISMLINKYEKIGLVKALLENELNYI